MDSLVSDVEYALDESLYESVSDAVASALGGSGVCLSVCCEDGASNWVPGSSDPGNPCQVGFVGALSLCSRAGCGFWQPLMAHTCANLQF